MLNKSELVKILETISRDKKLDPDEAMKLTEHLLELFRQRPIIREVPTPCPYPHYPLQPFIFPDPNPDPYYRDYTTVTTLRLSSTIVDPSSTMPDPALDF